MEENGGHTFTHYDTLVHFDWRLEIEELLSLRYF